MYLSQGWNVLQPSLLQAGLANGHALVSAPHVRGQQLPQVPLSRDVTARLEHMHVSSGIILQK